MWACPITFTFWTFFFSDFNWPMVCELNISSINKNGSEYFIILILLEQTVVS